MVARHIGKHVPDSPMYVARNMPGAGSIRAANYIYGSAPKDGTTIGIFGRDTPMLPLMGAKGAQFDAMKFSWIGSTSTDTTVCFAHQTSPVKTMEDLFKQEFIVGSAGIGSGTDIYPKVLSQLFGMKFKVISGYPGTADVFLAIERGEVQGICASLETMAEMRPDWIKLAP
jgi:tripartite-type tricarboxylate transporter receptor subunit TctC